MLKRLTLILILLALLRVPALAQDECEGVRCDANATGPLCEAVVLPVLIAALVWWLRK